MSTKTAKNLIKSAVRYAPEDLQPRDVAADEAVLDAYLKRNKDALDASVEKADEELKRGEYFTLDQAMSDVRAQRERRISRNT